MKRSLEDIKAEDYDIEGMLIYLKEQGSIDVRDGAQEAADILHTLGFNMGIWYTGRWNLSGYTDMYCVRFNGEDQIHLSGRRSGELVSLEEFLDRYYIGAKEPINGNFSSLFEQFYQQTDLP